MESTQTQPDIEKTGYGFIRRVSMGFDETVERTREELTNEGFGVLTEIRMDEKLKEKLGVDFRKYVILGACNPPLAYKVVQEDINIGLLLPCNVIVYAADDASASVVAAVDAKAMMSVAEGTSEMAGIAAEVNERLQRAIAAV